jgi:hypothetical protein
MIRSALNSFQEAARARSARPRVAGRSGSGPRARAAEPGPRAGSGDASTFLLAPAAAPGGRAPLPRPSAEARGSSPPRPRERPALLRPLPAKLLVSFPFLSSPLFCTFLRMLRRLGAVLFVAALAACGPSGAPPRSREADPVDREPARPLSLHLDLTRTPPVLTISATDEQLKRLRARYSSFHVELGKPVENIQRSITQGYDGSLDLPWPITLRDFSQPYPVRVVGTLPDRRHEVIIETVF